VEANPAEAILGGDALGERVRAREEGVMPGVKLEETGAGSDASALHVGGGGKALCADEVPRRLLPPGDLAR
jgi:hypothetical protein